jgi:glycine hydroxymethyltransferase
MHIIAAKAVCFKLAATEEFKEYQRLVVEDAKALASSLSDRGYRIVSGGTDNHLLLVDLRGKGVTGLKAQRMLEKARIYVNRNLVPYDDKPPYITSGLRLGTPCVAARGMGKYEMDEIAGMIDRVIRDNGDQATVEHVGRLVADMCRSFPIYDGWIV